jgi:hypothetical protein
MQAALLIACLSMVSAFMAPRPVLKSSRLHENFGLGEYAYESLRIFWQTVD